VSRFGPTNYGDPCRECGFEWSTPAEEADTIIAETPARYVDLLDGQDGSARHPDLTWTAGGYVWHVTDNFRIWSDRLAGIAGGSRSPIVPYDENELAASRGYNEMSVEGGLWALERAVGDYEVVVSLVDAMDDAVMLHPEFGDLPIIEVRRLIAHDAQHHGWDIERSVAR